MSDHFEEFVATDATGFAGAPIVKNDGREIVFKGGKLTITQKKSATAPASGQSAAVVDEAGDLIQAIENLGKEGAFARLGQLEEVSEKTYFEIGGVLSVIRKNKWFDSYPTFEDWVTKNTIFRPSKARALIQIYGAIVAAGVPWAKIKDVGWTKLRVIARVLKKENADHWIGEASGRGKLDLIALVKQHLAGSSVTKPHEPAKPKVKAANLKKKLIALDTNELAGLIVEVLGSVSKEVAAQVMQTISIGLANA